MKTHPPRAAAKHTYSCRASSTALESEFDLLVDKAIRAIITYEPNHDRIFGQYSELASVVRSVQFHEGKLLERGIASIARCNPDILILPPDRPMPIVPAAVELLKKNEWRDIQGIRLQSEVHTNRTYTPDLFIVNRSRHAGLIIDVKRCLGSYAESKLDALRFRMLAVAVIASSWLAERQGPILVDVGIAIIDGADICSDPGKGVFKISELGDLLEIDEAGNAMTRLRDLFAQRVQEVLDAQCRKVQDAIGATVSPAVSDGRFSDDNVGNIATDPEDLDLFRRNPKPNCPNHMLPLTTNVRIGFARSRAKPLRHISDVD